MADEDDPDLLDLLRLTGEVRTDDPETSHEAAWTPKGKGALRVLRFFASGRPATQRDCDRFYRDDRRSIGPRFKQLEDRGMMERVRRPDGSVLTKKQQGTSREVWRITDKGRALLAKSGGAP